MESSARFAAKKFFVFFVISDFLSQGEALKEIPHLRVRVDDIGRRTKQSLHEFLLSARPNVSRAGEFPERDLGAIAAV